VHTRAGKVAPRVPVEPFPIRQRKKTADFPKDWDASRKPDDVSKFRLLPSIPFRFSLSFFPPHKNRFIRYVIYFVYVAD
jgi:hypothetical protein